MIEFFVLTPLPGSEDHKVLFEKGVWMDPDLNKYDVEHVVTGHSKMTKEEWKGVIARPGTSSIPASTSRRFCAGPMPPA